jgi:PAS domain S-box-containing protein
MGMSSATGSPRWDDTMPEPERRLRLVNAGGDPEDGEGGREMVDLVLDGDPTDGGDRVPAAIGAWQLDLTTEGLWWSPEMHEIFGTDPESFVPTLTTLYPLLKPESRALLEGQVVEWRSRPQAFADLYRVQRPDGGRRLIEVRGWAGPGPRHGQAAHFLGGTCRDITQLAIRRRAAVALAREHEMILRAAGDGICGLDATGRVTFCNPALLVLMRREGDDLRGRRLHDLVHRDSGGAELHPLDACPFRAPEAGRSSATDTEFHRPDGSRIEVSYMRVAVDEPDMRGSVVSFRDITARRAAARLLQTSLRQVQSLNAQRGALLRHLAEAEERERMRLAADIHDDTIQALWAVTLRLSRAGEAAQSDGDREVLADAEVEVRGVAERLRQLTFELMPPVDGGDLRAAVESYCAVVFGESELGYEVVGDAAGLAADRALVAYRLIQEALRNARRHSRGSRVVVSFERTAAELVCRVADDGVGMGDAETPPTHAGLRIVRERAEAAGGVARFGPGLDGRGLTVELRLPRGGSGG